MAGLYDSIDLEFSWNGDFALGWEGDLADTSDDLLKALRQEIHTVCASYAGDWELYSNLGASLRDYVGEPNNRRTADAIHERLRLSLISAGVVAENDLELRVVPVHRHRVLIVVKIAVIPTAFNKMDRSTNSITTALVFDFIEQGIHFLSKVPEMQAIT